MNSQAEGVSTGAGFFSGIFSQLADAQEDDPIDPTSDMDSTLNDIFTTYNTMLDDILKLGVGGEGDYGTLPGQVSGRLRATYYPLS
jgi:hypothetical protein